MPLGGPGTKKLTLDYKKMIILCYLYRNHQETWLLKERLRKVTTNGISNTDLNMILTQLRNNALIEIESNPHSFEPVKALIVVKNIVSYQGGTPKTRLNYVRISPTGAAFVDAFKDLRDNHRILPKVLEICDAIDEPTPNVSDY